MPSQNIAIVGAGLAGLACARTLAAYGVRTKLFDKGRGPGGRLATRRIEAAGQVFHFDHGAQYLTARGPGFGAVLDAAKAAQWPDAGRRIGQPRMSSVPRALADGLEVALSRHVTAIAGAPRDWRLRHVDATKVRVGRPLPSETEEEDGPFDAVLLALPAPQAQPLLAGPAPRLAGVLDNVRMAPCWTLMAAFPSRLALADTLRLSGGTIAWAAREGSKPGRDGSQECWVAQASPAWSREHLEKQAPEVTTLLLAALQALQGAALPEPIFAGAHRWRYALVEAPLGAPCLWDPSLGLGAAGDWCIEARAEAAVDSGAALAAAIRTA
jgi:predicted NAD/FAD-dependent oxidoreductase